MPGSIVQIVGPGGASSAATSIVSSSITCTAGNQLWVIAISDDATISSITDSWSSGANTYTERGSVIEAGIPRRLHHATCQIATGGTGTVTVNLGASVSNRQVWLVEVTGVGAYDAQGTATDTGNNPTDSASATNSAQPAFCVAAIVDYQGGTPTVGQISGSAATNGGSLAAGGQLGGLVEYRSVSTVTAQTANFGNAGFDRTCTVFAVFLEDSAPTISVHPADQTVNDGATATFSVTATGGATPYTYQWQDNSSGSFANVSGATSSSYGPTASYAAQGRQYRCVVTGANSLSVTSNAATLRVAFNTSGTGPRAYPVSAGGAIASGSVESLLLGTASAGSSFEHVASGGLSFAGAATTLQSRNFTFSPSGGMTFAGSATVAEANDYAASASGGLTFGGTASAQLDVGFTFAGSGGFTLAGVASTLESNDYVHAAAGGLSFAGAATASESNDYAATSSGGILFGGVATVSLDVGFVVTGSGGISFAGAATAAESNDYAASGSGGILFGGEATVEGPAAPGGASDAGRAFWTRRRSR